MAIGRGKPRHYDPKQCFDTWIEAGTLELATTILYNKGVTSTNGEKPPVVSIQFSANNYIIQNPEEARKALIEKANLSYLKIDSEWHNFLIRRAKNALQSDSRFFNWLLHNDFLEIARELRLVPETYGQNRSV